MDEKQNNIDEMEITAKVDLCPPDSRIAANVNVVIGGCLSIKGFRVAKDDGDDVFVGFPEEKGTDGKYRMTVWAVTDEFKQRLTSEILNAFHIKIAEARAIAAAYAS